MANEGGWWCCCPCETITDNFARPDSNYIGLLWDEAVGNWTIESGALITTDAPAIAVWHVTRMPGVGIFKAGLKSPDSGNVYRISAFHGNSANPLGLSERFGATLNVYELGGSPWGELSYQLDGITVQSVKPVNIFSGPNPGAIQFCIGSGFLSASMSTDLQYVWDCPVSGYDPDWFFAVENGAASTETCKYEYVSYTDHLVHRPTCPSCLCGCEGNCMSRLLTVTAVNSTGCYTVDGMTWTLSGIDTCSWISDYQGCPPLGSGYFTFEAINPSTDYGSASGWKITFSVNGGQLRYADPVSSTCNPLRLVFQNFDWGNVPTDSCCEGITGIMNPDYTCPDGTTYPNYPTAGICWGRGLFDVEVTE